MSPGLTHRNASSSAKSSRPHRELVGVQPTARNVDLVRIWDLEPSVLCDRHLLGEHRELHAVWSILTTGKRGYANHPETLRWRGRLKALYVRHDGLVEEMKRRGFDHRSPLDPALATGAIRQTELLESVECQRERLRLRDCPCFSRSSPSR